MISILHTEPHNVDLKVLWLRDFCHYKERTHSVHFVFERRDGRVKLSEPSEGERMAPCGHINLDIPTHTRLYRRGDKNYAYSTTIIHSHQ